MKVLVTGITGQLGYDVCRVLKANNIEFLGVGRKDFDITDELATKSFIKNYNPTIIIHCSAYTASEKAEEERKLCEKVNVAGTRYIAEVCKELDATMVYISSDYVYSGEGDYYWEPKDAAKPVNWYGVTKLAGEKVVQEILEKYFILRISWAFGVNGNNFVKTMLKLAETRSELNVVADQIGSPTYMYDVAKLIVDMIKTDRYGIYNVSNEGICSWADFAEEIFRQSNTKCKVNRIKSEEYPSKVKRPLNSRMSKQCLIDNGFTKLSNWQDALARYLMEIGR